MVGRLLAALVTFAVAGACGGGASAEDPATRVVTTVAPITDLVATVAGPDATVEGLVPEGTDSHTYEPPPSAVRALSDADLFVANGLFLEQPALELARANLPDGAPIVTLADAVVSRDEWVFDASFPEEQGRPNPHLWTDPTLAAEYVRVVADALAEVDPEHADGYRARAERLEGRLADLDRAIAEAVATVPPEHRKLVTYHDSFPYFAQRYGFERIAAVQPADFSEPSAREVRGIIDQLRETGVPAVFGSAVFPSDVLRTIADETGARYVDDLRDDDLPGEPGDPEHSYLGMMVANVRTMVSALGGDPSALDAVDPVRTDEGSGRR